MDDDIARIKQRGKSVADILQIQFKELPGLSVPLIPFFLRVGEGAVQVAQLDTLSHDQLQTVLDTIARYSKSTAGELRVALCCIQACTDVSSLVRPITTVDLHELPFPREQSPLPQKDTHSMMVETQPLPPLFGDKQSVSVYPGIVVTIQSVIDSENGDVLRGLYWYCAFNRGFPVAPRWKDRGMVAAAVANHVPRGTNHHNVGLGVFVMSIIKLVDKGSVLGQAAAVDKEFVARCLGVEYLVAKFHIEQEAGIVGEHRDWEWLRRYGFMMWLDEKCLVGNAEFKQMYDGIMVALDDHATGKSVQDLIGALLNGHLSEFLARYNTPRSWMKIFCCLLVPPLLERQRALA
jgi:hypothetical protein